MHMQNGNSTKFMILDALSYLDLFGTKPNFRILKTPQFTSSLGYISSFLIVLICVQSIYTQLNSLLEGANPQIVVTENYSYDTEPFPLLKQNFSMGIMLVNSNLEQLKTLGTHWNLTIKTCNRIKIKKEDGSGSIPILNCTKLPIEPCKQQHFQNDVAKQYYKKATLGHVYCIDSDYWDKNPPLLQGTVQGWNYSYLTISITKCKNTTEYSNCADEEEIQKELNSGYYAVQMMNTIVKMSNQGSPFQEFISLIDTTFSVNSTKQVWSYFQILESITDIGLFSKEEVQEERVAVYSTQDTQSESDGETIINQIIRLQPRSITYQRSYPKLLNIVGNIGGLWQGAYLVLSLLLKPITYALMNVAIANKLFRFESEQVEPDSKQQSKQGLQNSDNNIDNIQEMDNQKDHYQLESSQRDYLKERSLSFDVFKDESYLKKFLKQRDKTLQMNFKEKMLLLLGCRKKLKQRIDYATFKFKTEIDLAYIINKLHEVDKLKNVLLTRDQLSLFNYLPKPIIPISLGDNNLSQFISNKTSTYILQEEKSPIYKLQEAYLGYYNIISKEEKTLVDMSIIENMDEEIKVFFQKILRDVRRFDIVFKSSRMCFTPSQDIENQSPNNMQSDVV